MRRRQRRPDPNVGVQWASALDHLLLAKSPNTEVTDTIEVVPFTPHTTMDTKDTKPLGPNATSHAVIEAALKVHSALGAGMLESTIGACLLYEMNHAGLHVRHQVRLPVVYRGVTLPGAYRVDFIVEECLIVEIKC